MLLPSGIGSFEEYCHLVLEFLTKYEWSYNFKAVEILMDQNILNVPQPFQKYYQLLEDVDFISILHHRDQEHWPEELKEFVRSCKLLAILEGEFQELKISNDFVDSKTVPEKWSLKKYEEVVRLSSFVGRNCNKHGCDTVVDIGSGLGYLSVKLKETFDLSIIAVEGQSEKTASAQQLLKGEDSQITNVNLNLTKDIIEQISPLVETKTRVCVTGLHACGDLTPWSLQLFLSQSKYQLLNIVPCCYHKMDLVRFQNLPMSKSLLHELSLLGEHSNLLSNQFCRLASQRMGENFLQDVSCETKHIFYRGLLEYYVAHEKYQLIKTKRKGIRGNVENFSAYITKSIGNVGVYKIVDSKAATKFEVHERNLMSLFEKMKHWWKPVTGILAMQGAVQVIAEQLILLDRLNFLLESDLVQDAELKRIIPKSVTPRGWVIHAVKKV